MSSVLLQSYFQLAFLFLAAMVFSTLASYGGFAGLPWLWRIGFILPVLLLPTIASASLRTDRSLSLPRYLAPALALLAIAFRLATALWPSARAGAPLGYDAGFYKYGLDVYLSALPNVPESSLEPWFRQFHEPGLFLVADLLHVFSGVSADQLLLYVLPALSALPVLWAFLLGRRVAGDLAGVLAAWLVAASSVQFLAVDFSYLRQIAGLGFLLLALYAITTRKWMMVGLLLAALLLYHRPELLLAALALGVLFLMGQSRRQITLATLVGMAISVPLIVARWDVNWAALWGNVQVSLGLLTGPDIIVGGSFVSPRRYVALAGPYLFLGISGALLALRDRRWTPLWALAGLTFLFVAFGLFFHSRFLLNLDLALALLAAVLVVTMAANAQPRWQRLAWLAIGLLAIVASLVVTTTELRTAEPVFTREQIESTRWLADHSPPEALVLASGPDAPLALGWSGRAVVTPGLLGEQHYGREEWLTFMDSEDPDSAYRFLAVYKAPLYVLVTDGSAAAMVSAKFQEPRFRVA
ncbi:MAG: hypothetical protein Q8O40_12015, partial [Chloroflexota bacterium]|nr:hypothetical protein [Chloroflexota bacterium]